MASWETVLEIRSATKMGQILNLTSGHNIPLPVVGDEVGYTYYTPEHKAVTLYGKVLRRQISHIDYKRTCVVVVWVEESLD